MKTFSTSYCFSVLIFIGLFPLFLKAGLPEAKKKSENPKKSPRPSLEILVNNIITPPFLDGIAIDKCWQLTPGYQVLIAGKKANQIINLKACKNGKNIFFLIEYQTESEDRQHQSWHWDPVLQAYIPGEEKEEVFTIVLAEKPAGNTKADVWIWRAARTDPVNKADDLFYFESRQINQPQKSIIMDKGEHCWFSKYFGDYAGAQLPRFYNRTPQGSVADVNAKGNWDKKHLKIEFSRLLKTGNKDDIQLKTGKFYIQIHRGTPSTQTINKNRFIPLILK